MFAMSAWISGNDVLLVMCTVPSVDKGKEIARVLVERRLCACVNIVPQLTSIYYWEGKLCEDAEALLLIKTSSERVEALSRVLGEIHPYETPEVLAFEVDSGAESYLSWVKTEMKISKEDTRG